MNALRQRTNLRSFFSTLPSPTQPQMQPSPKPKAKRQARSKKLVQPPQATTLAKPAKPYKKKKITGALREAVWIKTMGRTFEGKCPVVWCPNSITVFDFQSGHNIPESKGGSTTLPNLIPICARCNFSMGNQYTIDEWNALHAVAAVSTPPPRPERTLLQKIFCCFFKQPK